VKSSYSIRTANWEHDRDQLLAVRYSVFVDEQSVPVELECDASDDTALHWLAEDTNGTPIGTARMLPDGQIGRMAVARLNRGQGIGHALLLTLLDYAKQQNLLEVYLSSQTHALDFYQKLGFAVEGEEYMDAGIPHLTMRKRLCDKRELGVHGRNFAVTDLKTTTIELIAQAQRSLKILSFDLNHEVFDNNIISDLVSTLARKSRYSQVQLLIVDTSAIVKRGHSLLKLQRRLSTAISIKTVSCEPKDIKDNLTLVDDVGIICQSIRENEKMWANFNNCPIVSNYTAQFDELWNRAVEDKNIRPLDI
jgi:predicted GNAT family N-acyltransferase